MAPYRIHHNRSSNRGLSALPPHAQRQIENALASVARSAAESTGPDDVQFAGGMQLCGSWVAWAFEHEQRVLNVLAVEPDAEALDNRPLPVAA